MLSRQAGSTDDDNIDFYVFYDHFHVGRQLRENHGTTELTQTAKKTLSVSSSSVGSATRGRRPCFLRRAVAAWDFVAHCVARLLYYRRVILVRALFVRVRLERCETTQQNNPPLFVSEVGRQGGDTLAGTSQLFLNAFYLLCSPSSYVPFSPFFYRRVGLARMHLEPFMLLRDERLVDRPRCVFYTFSVSHR